MQTLVRRMLVLALLALAAVPALATAPKAPAAVQVRRDGLDLHLENATVELRLVRGDVLHVHYRSGGCATPPTLVMAPDAPRAAASPVTVDHHGDTYTLTGTTLRAVLDARTRDLTVYRGDSRTPLLHQRDLAQLSNRTVVLDYPPGAALYGVNGYTHDSTDTSGIVRSGMQVAEAGMQGQDGAPFVWSSRGFGVLVDTRGAVFDLGRHELRARNLSRPDVSYYLIAATPRAIFAAVNDLSGHPPLFPKWATGFTNSQWGIDQKELLDIVRTYRARHIPIDNFTLDFDWKAWGDDHYGEFRWNPVKFPDGPSGKLARTLLRQGVHLTGIMKPRLHVDTVEGRYATAHHLWFPGENAYKDYFSHKPVLDIDFDKPAARTWFGDLAMKYAFAKGIAGWWNDEADQINDSNQPIHDVTQFLNMQRALYEAQRRVSDVRVWSLNRVFWLGAQRYAYGMWSGDIPTGFTSMANQRERMLSAVDVGQTLWGMDIGGFQNGDPSPENYARWMEFGAFVPIYRVHGSHNAHRQPWVFGPVAEKAATRALRLRYRFIPYIYSYFRQAHTTGVGLVRPLVFGWPHDPNVRNDVSAWMFGRWMLVSPVVRKGQTEKNLYLPAGTWTNWFTGTTRAGGRTVHLKTDARTWSDIPLFVRQGAIIPTQPVMDYVGQHPVTTITVDVFPAAKRTHFDYYDDDGTTYAYEHGAYYLQRLSTQRRADGAGFAIDRARGTYTPPLRDYLVKVHGIAAGRVDDAGPRLGSLQALKAAQGAGWATGHDRFGPVTWLRLAAGHATHVRLHAVSTH